jgi:DNA-binding MarR family transcriptional regulator
MVGPRAYNTYMNDKSAAAATGLLPLLHAAATAEAYVELKLGAADLSLAKLAALSALVDAGESLPLGQLAERLSCVKSNVTQLVDRLEADGLVRRRPDPHDRRTRLAVVTAAGRKACKEGRRIQQQTERDLFGALTGAEARQLATLMGKVTPGPR